jgi:formate hydrogenlyase transcriptional activator
LTVASLQEDAFTAEDQDLLAQIGQQIALAVAALTRYHWPGNVRELENIVERAVILSRGSELEIPLGELKAEPEPELAMAAAASSEDRSSGGSTLEAFERDYIRRVLEETNWVVAGPAGAAQRLGMKRTTLQAKMRKLGITRGQ